MTARNSRGRAAVVGLVSTLAAVTALVFAVTAHSAPTKLVGTVGPGSTISLKTTTGKRVSMLPRGTYRVVIKDRSDEHNFAMRGPGVNRSLTGVEFVGTKTVTLKLGAGRFTFVCTPHSDDMRGTFGVN